MRQDNQDDIDRICAETLQGRFGIKLISPRLIRDILCPSASADAAATISEAAVWTNARPGIEQGKQ